MAYSDGTFSSWVQNGPARMAFPFGNAQAPDGVTRTHELNGVLLPSGLANNTATRATVTNLLTYSEAFDNAAWTKTGTTITADAVTNPGNSTLSADAMMETAANSEHRIERNYTFTAAAYTLSFFVKKIGRDYIRMMMFDATTFHTAFFNLSTGAVHSSTAGVTGTITAVFGSWYLVSMSVTTAAGVGAVYCGNSSDGADFSYAGDITKGLYLWGAQLELSASPSGYVSTTTASRAGSVPLYYARDPLALLVEEGEASIGAGEARQTRLYATIPGQQTDYGSQMIVRPVMHDIVSGSNWFVSFDNDVTSAKFTARKTIVSIAYYSATANTYEVTAHGFTAGQQFVMWAGDKICDTNTVAIITDADHIVCSFANQTAFPPTTINVAPNAAARYVNGAIYVDTKILTDFYLPGLTLGIATAADIPLVASKLDPVSWAAEIVAASTFSAVSISDIQQWHGPVISQAITYAQMADAITTVSVSA